MCGTELLRGGHEHQHCRREGGVLDELENQLIVFAVQTVFSCILAYPIARWAAHAQIQANSAAEFRSRLERLLDKVIDNPYFETEAFCRGWDGRSRDDERYAKYDVYCIQVFNLLENLYDHCGGKPARMKKHFVIDEYIEQHAVWWKSHENRGDNTLGYGDGFVTFVDRKIAEFEQQRRAA